ncbi:hypothetical protein GOODEAATRI_008664, partial [Goodea atripinnis]
MSGLCDVLQAQQQGPAFMTTGQFAPQALGRRDRPEPVQNARYQACDMRMQSAEQHNKVPFSYLPESGGHMTSSSRVGVCTALCCPSPPSASSVSLLKVTTVTMDLKSLDLISGLETPWSAGPPDEEKQLADGGVTRLQVLEIS